MPRGDLTPVSYVVLGLLARDGPSTPYELKVAVSRGIAQLWPFPHSQLYSEPERLTAAGLLEERREAGGRRRRVYRLTRTGREALAGWLADSRVDERPQVRDLALLKLFFGHFAERSDVVALARAEEERRLLRLEELEAMERRLLEQEDREYQLEVLYAAMEFDRAFVRFWNRVAARRPRRTGGSHRGRAR